jgi:hypothetical protein
MPDRRLLPLVLLTALGGGAVRADEATAGLQPEVTVAGKTRLDWTFAAAAFGPKAAGTADYESRKQHYQLFVPGGHDARRPAPLVVFVSPGDDPLGWRCWRKPCEESGALFCAAYGAGTNCPPGQRVRIVLDMLDDVRHHYRIDPDQTYLTGFSSGARMACTIAFALPEYFGGVVALGAANPLNDLGYLRHRARDRLSVAVVVGAEDAHRREMTDYWLPIYQAHGLHTRLWVVPKMRHEVPGPEVVGEVYRWLAEDLKRRQEDRRAHPELNVGPEGVADPLGRGMLEAGEADLRRPGRTWEGVALLEGVVARCGYPPPGLQAAEKARQRLKEVQADPERAAQLAEQREAEERKLLLTEAEALERLGNLHLPRALKAWQLLLKHYPTTPAGQKATEQVPRLSRMPYLGAGFTDGGATVNQIAPRGPAADAGLRVGDVVVRFDKVDVASEQDITRVLGARNPGDRVAVEVRRGEKSVPLTMKLGSVATAEE